MADAKLRKHADLRATRRRARCGCDQCQLDVDRSYRAVERFAEMVVTSNADKRYLLAWAQNLSVKVTAAGPGQYRVSGDNADLSRLFALVMEHGWTLGRKMAEKFGEGSTVLNGVEIFATGKHRDKDYSEQDLAEMVRNFRAYSSGRRLMLRVPAVLGHEENQELLERSDLPAAAWASALWQDRKECPACAGSGVKGGGQPGQVNRTLDRLAGDSCASCSGRGHIGVLKANFSDVAPKIARLLKGRAYRQVSAEVYDEPPEGIPGEGKMLRRVAFPGWRNPAGQDAGGHPGSGGTRGAGAASGGRGALPGGAAFEGQRCCVVVLGGQSCEPR